MKYISFITITIILTSHIAFAAQSKNNSSPDNISNVNLANQSSKNKFRVSGGVIYALAGILSVKGEYLLNNKMALGADLFYGSKKTESTDKSTTTKPHSFSYTEYNFKLKLYVNRNKYFWWILFKS